MGKQTFTEDYKKEIVRLITELGKKPVDVARDIGVTATSVRRWVRQFSEHGENAFPGKGKLRPADAELKALEKRNKDLQEEIAILKKANGHLHQGREIKYLFIKEHSSEFFVKKMCQVLEVSRSAYYDWLKRPVSYREENDKELIIHIKEIFDESDSTYGHRRIKKALRKRGIKTSNQRVRRLMKENGLISVLKSKYKATTNSNHNYPVAPNLLNKDFKANRINQKWVGDITYIATQEGWLYLAAIEDLYHKKIVGWSLDGRITKQLTIKALEQAIRRERPPKGLIFHSDRGSQYAAYDYQDKLKENGIMQSMSAKGDCYDNACMESFFATLKKDLVHRKRFKTREEAKLAIINYIETWYNCKRSHSGLDYMSPMEYQRNHSNSHTLVA
ncbi:MAG: IS3 family transposase [Desulfitobacteriia bacterium]